MKCAVLGTGSWGTALAQVLADNGCEVVLWGRSEEEVHDLNEHHRNTRYFQDTVVSDALRGDTNIACIHQAELLLAAVPSIALAEVLSKALAELDHPVLIVNVAKGFHPQTHELLSSYILRNVPADRRSGVVSLIGPSHAEEVILRQLTAVNAVSADLSAARKVQQLFSNSYFRVYTNTDVIGAETGVAVKNIMAIAAGILEGIGQGDNARAALITRGLAEMTRFGLALGGKASTYLGLDGVGDLVVTCTSCHSRNFMAGLAIGQSGSAAQFLAHNNKTVEGISACRIVYEEAHKRGISMPITDQMYEVLFRGRSPQEAIQALMKRNLKAEF